MSFINLDLLELVGVLLIGFYRAGWGPGGP